MPNTPEQYFSDGTYIYTQEPDGTFRIVGTAESQSVEVPLGEGVLGQVSTSMYDGGTEADAAVALPDYGLKAGANVQSIDATQDYEAMKMVQPYASADLSNQGLPLQIQRNFGANAGWQGSLDTSLGTVGGYTSDQGGYGASYNKQLSPSAQLEAFYNSYPGMAPQYGFSLGYQRKF